VRSKVSPLLANEKDICIPKLSNASQRVASFHPRNDCHNRLTTFRPNFQGKFPFPFNASGARANTGNSPFLSFTMKDSLFFSCTSLSTSFIHWRERGGLSSQWPGRLMKNPPSPSFSHDQDKQASLPPFIPLNGPLFDPWERPGGESPAKSLREWLECKRRKKFCCQKKSI